ncbi:type II toxin-antitoxin system RelE/ParE family toxin [Rosenbergiella collisarenosi]|uniref:type II toxin-antitoxin system RelE/ParE family toxin n=1 Tax=Rosenbergiella collisarenosi TaxID=1544695 RepID=UPI001F4E9059|nr:type II toxin-antitoxin system RelE/ParE family toxin [Rosenbergiella collisarenosi]
MGRTLLHFIETPIFQRLIDELLTAEEYQKFQAYLLLDPNIGSTIAHTGGCRKIRWALPAKGKSGGIRVIYYYVARDGKIHLLYAYPKSEQENLTDKQKAVMKHFAQQIEDKK